MYKNRLCFSTYSRLLEELPNAAFVKTKFQFQKNTITINEIKITNIEKQVTINGWLDRKPKKVGKNLIFGTLRDTNGELIQIVDTDKLLKEANVEDVIQVKGIINTKKASVGSKVGEKIIYEIKLQSLSTLNKSNEKPSQLQDFKVNGSYPPQYRYLQLRLPKYQNYLIARHNIVMDVRTHFNNHGFKEIETPLLFKSTPEGAREFLVPARKESSKDNEPSFYSLPQSPQQYKQLLMASGVHRYFQIAKCFRDENLRADRQPEFTQVDMEMAFSSGEEVMKTIENIIGSVWRTHSQSKELLTLDNNDQLVQVTQKQPIHRITYNDCMTKYGIDKPDLRAPQLQIVDLTEFNVHGIQNPDFPIFEILVLKKAFKNKDEYLKKWSFLKHSDNYNFRSPIIVPIDTFLAKEKWSERFLSIASFENPKLISKYLNLEEGDIVCGSTRESANFIFENPTPLGRVRQLVLENSEISDSYMVTGKDVATWVVDFPLFSPVEKDKTNSKSSKQQYPFYEKHSFSSTHHPFTMVKLDDYNKLKTSPLSCAGQHYDLVVNGVELGGGSTRIHDPEVQNYIFENILKIKNSKELFGHLLTAFKMGTPPHSGLAIGLDRMCAMLSGTKSIRDVIAFPKSVSGSDLIVGSPSKVPKKVLNLYNIGQSQS